MTDMNDIQDCADALLSWFEDQEIGDVKAVQVMAYLTGAMCVAESDQDLSKIICKLETVNRLALVVALTAVNGMVGQ